MQLPNSALKLICLGLFAALASCQRPAPVPESQPAPAPPPLEGEALKQHQQHIALDAREIIQQYRYSMALLRNPDSMKQIAEEDRAIAQQIRDSTIVTNTFGIWRVGDQTLDTNGAYDYLKPSEFPDMPEEIAAWLEERDYTIPQVIPRADTLYMPEFAKPQNAFGRQLSDKEQTDWLVYCNSGPDVSIYIFWDSATQNVEALHDSLSYLRMDCCNYLLSAIKPQFIRRDLEDFINRKYPGKSPEIHYGISLGLFEKHSTQRLYKTNSEWIFFNDYE
ncbi:MAG: hypothetical protein HOC20_06830 [Chloroflexi bacterium]|nr:hypothetical protein [Chloroflexota bacterium]